MATVPIHISHALNEILTQQQRADLLADFKYWKGSARGHQTEVFGRDVLNNGSKYLRHVHMVPKSSDVKFQAWKQIYDHNQEHNGSRDQLSDRYLFYVFDNQYGFLLLHVINDPGGHTIWEPRYRSVLKNWEEIAEDFVNLGALPK